MRYLPTSQLKDLLPTAESQLPDDVLLIKMDVLGDVELLSDTRQVRFVISTGAVDRDRDVIHQTGWQLDNYQRNPVVLWAHSSWEPPIAKAVSLGVSGDSLTAVAEFASPDVYPFADTVYQLLMGGFLRATSVGFRPLELTYDTDRGGYNFLRSELLEFSVCPVPCNPQCLMDAKSKGVELAPLKSWAERTLDQMSEEPGLWLPRSQVEAVFAALSTTTLSLPAPRSTPAPTPASPPAPLAASVSPSTDAVPALADLEPLYRQTGQTPPWQLQPEVWAEYLLLTRAVHDAGEDVALKSAAEEQRDALAAQLVQACSADVETPPAVEDDTDELTLDLDPDAGSDAGSDLDPDSITLDLDDLQQGIRAAVGEAFMAITGRVPDSRLS
jgi:HK97 family phage prohead protease